VVTTIQIEEELKNKLDELKIHHRETYNELLLRLVHGYSPNNLDKESLVETIEIISDSETMRDIASALDNYEKGKWKTLNQIEKELKK